MNNSEIRDLMESIGVEPEKIDEFLYHLDEAQVDMAQGEDKTVVQEFDNTDLKTQMLTEPDWRKRASLAAQILAKNLE